jgi:hypothetical protein
MTNLDRTARLRAPVAPGWLVNAMPDWLTEAVRPKPAPVPWGAMVRAALASCVPLSVGIVVGRREPWLVLAIGGLVGTVIDTGGPYLVRVKRAVTAGVFGGAAGLVIGMLIHHRGWVAVASLVVVAGVSALISRLGSTASVTGLLLLIFAALGLGSFGALRPWWSIALGFVGGVGWALLLCVPGWLLSPRSAEQSAVADVYRAFAGDLRAIGTDRAAGTRRAVTAAQHRVRHPAHRASDGRRPRPAHDAPDGGPQRQFPGVRGGRHAPPCGQPAAAARRRHPRLARRRDRVGRPRAQRATDPAALVVQPWLARAARCAGGPCPHYRVDARHAAHAGAADTAARARPGCARHPARPASGRTPRPGPSPSG